MKAASWMCLLAGALPVFSSALKPLVAYDVNYVDVPQKRHLSPQVFENLEERIPTIHLGTYSLAKQFPKDFVLLQVRLGSTSPVNTLGDTVGVALSATVTCPSCYITGDAVITTTGIKTDDSILKDIIKFFKDPTEVVVNALDLNLEVSLENFGGHFEFDIAFAGSGTYTVQLWKSETPVGVMLNENDKVGLLLSLEMIFTVTAQVDFTTGFDIIFPPGTNFILNPLSGEIVSMNIGGVKVNSIPFQFKKGSACITAVLRLKVQVGVSVLVLGKGFDFEAGLFWDPAVYKACVTYQPTSPCEISLTEGFYEDAGAYARAVVNLDFAKLSAGPTAVTTYFTAALPSQCLETSKSTPLITTVQHTTTSAPTVKQTTPPIRETSLSGKQTTTLDTIHTSTKSSTSSKHTSTTSPYESASTKSTTATSKSSSEVSSEKSSISSHSSTLQKSSSTTTSSKTASHMDSSATKQTSTSRESSATKSTSNSQSQISSGAPYGNYSMMTTSARDTATSSANTATITAGPVSTETSLTTRTIYTTEIYTITACMSLLEWCPYSLVSEMTQTKTIIQYTTICPATQTSFPSSPSSAAQPAAAATSSTAPASTTAPAPVVVTVTNHVQLTSCATPIVSTVAYASPAPPITYTLTGSGTTVFAVVNATVRGGGPGAATVAASSTSAAAYIVPGGGMWNGTYNNATGTAAGYSGALTPTPVGTTKVDVVKVQGTASASASASMGPSYVKTSGARRTFLSSSSLLVVEMVAALVLGVVFS